MPALAALLCALACALPAHAEELSAGFAPGQVWLSKSAPLAGESVEIYTVIYDASGTPLEGSVSFRVDGETIGSVPFTLSAGETEVQSVRWRATPGTHALTAAFDTAIHRETKKDAGIKGSVTATTTVTVAEPEPEPEREARAARTATPDIVAAASAYPIVANVVAAAESVRTGSETLVASYIGTSTPRATEGGIVLGNTTEQATDTTLVSRAAETALPLFAYPALFYPLVLTLLLFLLWLVARKLRNPRRRRQR